MGISTIQWAWNDSDASLSESAAIIIQGVTSGGKTFRPSDWAERLSGVMSIVTDDNRLSYSPHLKPIARNGVKCVLLSKKLLEVEPQVYAFLLDFARDNDLRVVEAQMGAENTERQPSE
jgi:hypothetical protein